MGRVYCTHFKDVAVTAAQDLFEILAASAKPVTILGWGLTQKTEVADAAEEMLLVTTNRGVGATSGSGGSTHTAVPRRVADTASGATVEINNTSQMTAGGGSVTEEEAHAWNIRVPFVMWYPPECRPQIAGGDRWTLELETAPTDSVTMSGNVWFEEPF